MSKVHEIKSIEDIAKAVNLDNVDNFLKDFELVLRQFLFIKALDSNIRFSGFDWCDDGEIGGEVKLKLKDGSSEVTISAKVTD